MAEDSFQLTQATLETARAAFDAVAVQRARQLATVAISLALALASGWAAVEWMAKHRNAANEWFPAHSLGPDLRGAIVVVVVFFVPAALALFSLISWFRVIDGRVTGSHRAIVEALAPQLDGPFELGVSWGSGEVTNSSSSKVQFVSRDLLLKGEMGGRPFSLTIEDHDSMRRRSSTAQRMHVTFWLVTAQLGETRLEARIEGEALPPAEVMAVVTKLRG